MGMSSSQVRFLSLQHRKHNVGQQLSALSNKKMALTRDMRKLSKNYNNEMNQIRLKFSNNCGINNYDLTYDTIMKPNELNAEYPLILTDNQGRVVVDDNEITYEKNGETVHTGLTYRQLAQMISAYSGTDTDGNLSFDNTDRLADFGGELFHLGDLVSSATSGEACGITDGYKIAMNASELDFGCKLRYDILNKLGFVSENNLNEYTSTQIALYGPKKDKNEITDDLSVNNQIGTNAYYNNSTDTEKATFGKIVVEGNNVSFEGGSLYGNLALAKQYLAEYKQFLNTPMEISFSEKNGINAANYRNTTPGESTGITDRIWDLLQQTGEINSNGKYLDGQSALTLMGNVNNVRNEFFIVDTSWSDTQDSKYYGLMKDVDWDQDGPGVMACSGYSGTNVYEMGNPDDFSTFQFSWDDLYSKEGRNTGYSLMLAYPKDWGSANTNIVRQFLGTLANYLSGIGVNDKDALEYAQYMTTATFCGYDGSGKSYEEIKAAIDSGIGVSTSNSDHAGSTNMGARAACQASPLNQAAYYEDEIHDGRYGIAINMQNILNTFITYYQVYAENNGVPSTTSSSTAAVPAYESLPLSTGKINDILSGYTQTSDYWIDQSDFDRVNVNGISYWHLQKTYKDYNTNNVATEDLYYDADYWMGHGTAPTTEYDNSLEKREINFTYSGDTPEGAITKYIEDYKFNMVDIYRKEKEATSNASFDGCNYVIDKEVSNSVYATNVSVKYKDNGLLASLENTIAVMQEELYEKEQESLIDPDDTYSMIEGNTKAAQYFDALLKRISENGWVYDEKVNNKENPQESITYLDAMLQNRQYMITEVRAINDNGKFQYYTKEASNVNRLYQVHEENEEQEASAKYDAERAIISAKTRRIDSRMIMLETEQETINTEVESLKKVRNENIDNFFKIFA